jgi:(2S)-methylsuccinyl-CoA dehydrogenase
MLDKAQGRNGAKLVALAREATQAAEAVLADATRAVRRRVTVDNQMVDTLLDREQRATHGLAWLATYVESVRQLAAYAERMLARGALGEIEELIVEIGIGEYLAQIQGIPMSQGGSCARPTRLAAGAVAAPRGPLDGLAGSTMSSAARLVERWRIRARWATAGSS